LYPEITINEIDARLNRKSRKQTVLRELALSISNSNDGIIGANKLGAKIITLTLQCISVTSLLAWDKSIGTRPLVNIGKIGKCTPTMGPCAFWGIIARAHNFD
jgi:hypothetical protein